VTGLEATHADEPHSGGLANRLNWLRAGVLGANDGIVSVAAIAVGVAGATPQLGPILAASVAGLVGGAISMALGEYVSVSSQRDSEHALIAKEKTELATMPHEELAELTKLYQDKGLSPQTARQVAEELTFTIGGLLPILAIILFPASMRISATFVAVLAALAITGAIGGYLGDSPILRPMVRVVVGGALALAATFLIGRLLGTTVLS